LESLDDTSRERGNATHPRRHGGLERFQRIQGHHPGGNRGSEILPVERSKGEHLVALMISATVSKVNVIHASGSFSLSLVVPIVLMKASPSAPVVHDDQSKDVLHGISRPQTTSHIVAFAADDSSHLELHIQRPCRSETGRGTLRSRGRASKTFGPGDWGTGHDDRGGSAVVPHWKVRPGWGHRRALDSHQSASVGGVIDTCA
jgi:hypothetical protein